MPLQRMENMLEKMRFIARAAADCPGLPGGCICAPAASASPTPEPKFFRDARRV
jgi:hypothetical protein